MDQIVTEKLCRKCGVTSPSKEFYKQKSAKDGLQSYCKKCAQNNRKIWVKENPIKAKKLNNTYYQNNVNKVKKSNNLWKENNREKYLKMMSDWYKSNKEKHYKYSKEWVANNKNKVKATAQKWRKTNKHKKNIDTANRRSTKLNATPSWANLDAIKLEYELAVWCSKVMGEPYHVDHIIPLRGKNVSGLHVENNLQVIRAKENSSKSNKYDVS